ncbi:hypothetical protein Poly51_60620 [Rubripirellula tenax]|uniref:PHP domain protein n=1 Tax=Rubripirellula tenax TaxID=2528015 RepID=A0A5C6EAI3_9BACT|nr:PHP domain-containing protein [Rubripirellula tenax]TWU44496.1 hypothetical protein Poly51_60620 [Rubripirellula tenax]
MKLPLLVALFTCTLTLSASAQSPPESSKAPRWWKGNLHTHSLWSDGDQFPEMIADWYRQRDYNFLALTDHNVLSEGTRWMSMSKVIKKSDAGILGRYRDRFGEAWVETRGEPGNKDHEVRLKPLDEFRYLLEQSGRFILIPAEEISDKAEGKPVHINATNIAEALQPIGGETVRQTIENNLRAILEHEKSHGREVLPHVNHPNFFYAITADDLAAVVSERFFEVYNGHPGVNQLGDADHPGVERFWDIANAIRRNSLNIPPLMGIATDDSHEYHGQPGSRPGRGWVMVRSRYLTPEHLIRAMKRGDFYASSGVTLSDVKFYESTRTLSIHIDAEPDTTYRTDFIATLARETDTDTDTDTEHASAEDVKAIDEHRIGVTVATSDDVSPTYLMNGQELYVRAVITSSKPHDDPSFSDQKQQAWTQPVGWSE